MYCGLCLGLSVFIFVIFYNYDKKFAKTVNAEGHMSADTLFLFVRASTYGEPHFIYSEANIYLLERVNTRCSRVCIMSRLNT